MIKPVYVVLVLMQGLRLWLGYGCGLAMLLQQLCSISLRATDSEKRKKETMTFIIYEAVCVSIMQYLPLE